MTAPLVDCTERIMTFPPPCCLWQGRPAALPAQTDGTAFPVPSTRALWRLALEQVAAGHPEAASHTRLAGVSHSRRRSLGNALAALALPGSEQGTLPRGEPLYGAPAGDPPMGQRLVPTHRCRFF